MTCMSRAGLATFALLVASTLSAAAQSQAGAPVGRLTCELAPNVAYIIGSVRELNCTFTSGTANARAATFKGELRRFGLDIGINGKGTLSWNVLAHGGQVNPNSLRGSYLGASGSAGSGAGASVLVGGVGHAITLQPASADARTGINLGLGVSRLTLR